MQTTKNGLKNKNENTNDKSVETIPSTGSKQSSAPVIQTESAELSKNLAYSLMGLIKDVNKDGVTPETVNASCNAGNVVYKILRLNFEMKKEGF